MSSPPTHAFRDAFSNEAELASPGVTNFRLPVAPVVCAITRAARLDADRLYEALLKTALIVEMSAQTYGLAIFQQREDGTLTTRWTEGLDDAEAKEGEAAARATLTREDGPPPVRAGEHSFCLLLARPVAGILGAVIYGRCVRPLSEAQAGDLRTLVEVTHLAHEHVALRGRNASPAAIPALEKREREAEAPDEGPAALTLPGVVYESRALAQLARSVNRIKDSNSTVLITGESGTGKELIAHAIHRLSRRAQGPFIPFNCTAAPSELIESILFGHRKGSFTGAHADHEGLIRAAEGGTLFLDEIGDLPVSLQPKLLRFLQEGEVHTLGEREPRRVNVRVVAATHKDLERAVAESAFRQDLYYRVAALTLHLPPLRERPEDTVALISHFLTYYTRRNDRDVRGITWEAVNALQQYQWPGNVRELAAEIERLVLYADPGTYIGLADLNPRMRPAAPHASPAEQPEGGPAARLDEMLDDAERRIITETLKRHDYNVALAAAALGLGSRQTLYKKLKRLAIKINDQPGEE